MAIRRGRGLTPIFTFHNDVDTITLMSCQTAINPISSATIQRDNLEAWVNERTFSLDSKGGAKPYSLRNRTDMSRKLKVVETHTDEGEGGGAAWLSSEQVAVLLHGKAWCMTCDKPVEQAEAFSEYSMGDPSKRRTLFCVRCHGEREDGICNPTEMAKSVEKIGRVPFFQKALTASPETEKLTAESTPMLQATSESVIILDTKV